MSRLLQRGGVLLEGSAERLSVQGNVDFEVAAALAEAGGAWLADRSAGACVVLDLGGVEQVSSAALSVLLEWARRARTAGVEVGQVRLSPPLARLTRVAGLDELLPLSGEA